VRQARVAAGERDVYVIRGASIAQQCIRARLLDELRLHVVPVALRGGIRLLTGLGDGPLAFEQTAVEAAGGVTHLRLTPLAAVGSAE
jgi:dihydrofolate reductase